MNQILEDMLRACVISSKGSWEKWLPLAKFSYNNSYQESIKMAPFEALYGHKYRTPLNWIELGERRYYGIDFVTEAEEEKTTNLWSGRLCVLKSFVHEGSVEIWSEKEACA